MQTVLPAILALTYPGSRSPLGPPSGIQGIFAEVNKWSVLLPLGTMFLTGLANMLYVGPKTTQLMKERKHQGNTGSMNLWPESDEFVYRNKGWKEELRCGATFDGDAEVEQSLW